MAGEPVRVQAHTKAGQRNPPGTLYHVTPEPNARLIQQKGFHAGFRCSESGIAACVAERILAGEDEEDAWEDVEEGLAHDPEASRESRARNVFNDILDRNMPKGRDLPSHSGGTVFFWSDKRTAEYRRSLVETPHHPMRTVEVDAEKIPCRCYQADAGKTDELFEQVYGDVDRAEVCVDYVAPPEDWGDDDEAWCNGLEQLARNYYAEMKPWDGKPKPDEEVLCPCDIPPEAIRRIR